MIRTMQTPTCRAARGRLGTKHPPLEGTAAMLRPENAPEPAGRPHVTIDGRHYILTTWVHMQAMCDVIECPDQSGWAFGTNGDRHYAASYGSGAL